MRVFAIVLVLSCALLGSQALAGERASSDVLCPLTEMVVEGSNHFGVLHSWCSFDLTAQPQFDLDPPTPLSPLYPHILVLQFNFPMGSGSTLVVEIVQWRFRMRFWTIGAETPRSMRLVPITRLALCCSN